MNLESKF